MICNLTSFALATLITAANTIPALQQAKVQVGLPYQITKGTDRCFATSFLSDGQVAVLAYKQANGQITWIQLENLVNPPAENNSQSR